MHYTKHTFQPFISPFSKSSSHSTVLQLTNVPHSLRPISHFILPSLTVSTPFWCSPSPVTIPHHTAVHIQLYCQLTNFPHSLRQIWHFILPCVKVSTPFWWQSVACVTVRRDTTVRTSRSFFNLWQPRLCFSAGKWFAGVVAPSVLTVYVPP